MPLRADNLARVEDESVTIRSTVRGRDRRRATDTLWRGGISGKKQRITLNGTNGNDNHVADRGATSVTAQCLSEAFAGALGRRRTA